MKSTDNVNTGEPVRVYKNLHRSKPDFPVYSIQARREGKWRVVAHSEEIFLTRVKFQVGEKARQRVVSTRTKNVHAFVTGDFLRTGLLQFVAGNPAGFHKVSYNPYEGPRFYNKKGNAVSSARKAWVGREGVWTRA